MLKRLSVIMWSIIILLAPWQMPEAHAYRLRTLYTFCSESNCTDGQRPLGGLLIGADGALYGTTSAGGAYNWGSVFRLLPNATRTRWKYKVIHDFCAQPECADGKSPSSTLIADAAGNLYGTTAGGPDGGGIAYELKPNLKRTKWHLFVHYAFCLPSGCGDDAGPTGSLAYAGKSSGAPYDGVSPLYGVTSERAGTVFMLTRRGRKWSRQTLYTFCSLPECADGDAVFAGVTMDPSGNLFGATFAGGAIGNWGTVFELSPGVGGFGSGAPTETVLYAFCGPDCHDGAFPTAEVHLDAQGNLFGTTFGGGNIDGFNNCNAQGRAGCGVVFELSRDGANWQETVLHVFCSKENCVDGSHPRGAVLLDKTGTLYGITRLGGKGFGTTFKYDGSEEVIHRFCIQADCSDGYSPVGDLVMDSSGNLFGTTAFSGTSNDGGGGTVFEMTP